MITDIKILDEVVWLIYRYIEYIIDQSNWSGPFSLVVMTPTLVHPIGSFCLYILPSVLTFHTFCISPPNKLFSFSSTAYHGCSNMRLVPSYDRGAIT